MSAGLKAISLNNEATYKAQSAYAAKFTLKQIGEGSIQKTSLGIKSHKVFQTNEFRRFQDGNKDLYHAISKSDKAKEIYAKKEIRTRGDLVDVVAEAAHDQLSDNAKEILTKGKLKEDPFTASLLAMNAGGIRDLVNQDKSFAEMLLSGDAQSHQKETIGQLAQKAADLFEKDHALNDRQFFENNPNAAVYVIQNKDVVKDFTETEAGKDRAEAFRDEIRSSANQTIITNATNDFIQSHLQSGAYDEEFLNDHPDFTAYIAASLVLEEKPTVAEILKKNPRYNLRNSVSHDRFNETEVTEDILAKQAFEKLGPGSEVKETDLKKKTGLAQLILKNVSLQEEFKKEDVQEDLSILLGKQRPKTETPKEIFEKQFRTDLKERTLVSVIA